MEVTFHLKALEQYNYWALKDKKTFKKINKLLNENRISIIRCKGHY